MKIYTDGAVSNNGSVNSIGGWAYVIINDDDKIIKSNHGKVNGATNQQMELTAVIKACEENFGNIIQEKNNPFVVIPVQIYCDSAYVVNCFLQNWWTKWEKNGWQNSKKQSISNKNLWERLIPFYKKCSINFIKVKGHTGEDKWNEFVDNLAVQARLK